MLSSRAPSDEFFHHRSALASSARVPDSHAYEAEDPRVVFVGGVPYDLSANAVSDEFGSIFGSVTDVRLVPHRRGSDGEHKGYGFVTFADENTALSARHAGTLTLGGGVVVDIKRAERGIGRFSDDRSSTATAVSIESGMTEAASFHSRFLARNVGSPTSLDFASDSKRGRHGASAREAASGPARGATGRRRGASASCSSSRARGSPRDDSAVSNGRGSERGGNRVGGRRKCGGHRRSADDHRWPLPSIAKAESTAIAEAYWMFRERLEYERAFASALRDFYDNHGVTPSCPSIAGAGPDRVPIPSSGGFSVMESAAAPVTEPSASVAASIGRLGAREIFVGGLPMDTRDCDLEWFFSHWGAVEGSRVMHNCESSVSRRFGLVRFATESAASAVKALGVVYFADGTLVEVGDASRASAARAAGSVQRGLSDLSAALAAAKLESAAAGAGVRPGVSSRVSRASTFSGASSGTATPDAGSSASTADADSSRPGGGGGVGSPVSPGGAKTEPAASPPTVLRWRAA